MKSEKLTTREIAILLSWWLLVIIYGAYMLACITGKIQHSVGLMFGGTIVVLLFPALAETFTQKK